MKRKREMFGSGKRAGELGRDSDFHGLGNWSFQRRRDGCIHWE